MKTPRFNGPLMADDMAAQGKQPIDIARRCRVASSTVTRFLRNESQTPGMGKRFAKVLGQPLSRYLIRLSPEVGHEESENRVASPARTESDAVK